MDKYLIKLSFQRPPRDRRIPLSIGEGRRTFPGCRARSQSWAARPWTRSSGRPAGEVTTSTSRQRMPWRRSPTPRALEKASLARKPQGVAVGWSAPGRRRQKFPGGIDPVFKTIPESLQGGSDSGNFYEINADAENHGRRLSGGRGCRFDVRCRRLRGQRQYPEPRPSDPQNRSGALP